MNSDHQTHDIAALTVKLLSAYLANNSVASQDLGDLIRSTRAALTVDDHATDTSDQQELFTPAVSVRKSLSSPENIISLVDGKPYKTLKRHLASQGLTPKEYRSRYNLPENYPMVAPAYAARRREIAQEIGLGKLKGKADSASGSATASLPTPSAQQRESGELAADKSKDGNSTKRTPRSKRGAKGQGTPAEHSRVPAEANSLASEAGSHTTDRKRRASKTKPGSSIKDETSSTAAGKPAAPVKPRPSSAAQATAGLAQSSPDASAQTGSKPQRRARLTLFKNTEGQ